ncbi:MAG: methyl-accepting chemotaxis protein [Nitrospiraceae bacterium]|nr:MAG: methyl-accepting chemotaxis protein [Nitrospiraceae bacterium]
MSILFNFLDKFSIKIRKKLLIGIIPFSLLICLITIGTFFYNSNVLSLTENYPEVAEAYSLMHYLDESREAIKSASSVKMQQLLENQSNIESSLVNLVNISEGKGSTEIKRLFDQYFESAKPLLFRASEQDITSASSELLIIINNAEEAIHKHYHDKHDLLIANILTIRNSSLGSRYFILLITVLTVLSVIAAVYLTHRDYGTSVDRVIDIAHAISRGDLTVDNIQVRSHDEIEKFCESINTVKHNFSRIVMKITDTINKLSSFSTTLLSSSENISKDTSAQVENTGKVASAVEMMSIVVYDVTRNSANAAKSATEAAELAARGGAVVAETIEGMNKISFSVNKSADTITVLGERSEQIGEIIKVINDIANQTNLLALNAAIEAARAGEQGRGFAVVADEVRKLAERTTTATKEIGDMIKHIQEETRNAVESMQSATKEVEEGVMLANQADESLKHIMTSVQSVMDMVQQIAESAKQQSSTGEHVSSNLQEIADENQRTANAALEYYGTTREMNVLSEELKSLIASFRVNNNKNGIASS